MISISMDSHKRKILYTAGGALLLLLLWQLLSTLGGVRDIESEVRRLRKKGWSAAKIDRLLRDQQKAREKLGREPIDSFVFWANILNDVLALRGVNGAGLLVHQYSGSIADEHVSAQRREIRRGEIEVELPAQAAQ